MTYEAKAIGSGSEGAQSTLQVSHDDPCTSTLYVVACMMGLMTQWIHVTENLIRKLVCMHQTSLFNLCGNVLLHH